CQMTGRCVEYRFGKKKRTGSLRTFRHDFVVESSSVDYSAVRDGENQGDTLDVEATGKSPVFQRRHSGRDREMRGETGTSQARMRGKCFRNSESLICSRVEWTDNCRGIGLLSSEEFFPDHRNVVAERRDPTHSTKSEAHGTIRRRITEALVPPNPNEL